MKFNEYLSNDDVIEEELFGDIVIDLIDSLDFDNMSEEQGNFVGKIFENLDEDISEGPPAAKVKKTSPEEKRKHKKDYKKNKQKLKKASQKFRKSAAGKQFAKKQKRMAKKGLTGTGKKITRRK